MLVQESQRGLFCSYIFDKLAKPAVASHETLRASNDIVAVRQESSDIGGRVGNDIEDVPHVFGGRKRRPLEGQTKGRCVCWDGDKDLANLLPFGAVDSKADVGAGTVAQFLDEEAWLGVVLVCLSCMFASSAVAVWAYDSAAIDADD